MYQTIRRVDVPRSILHRNLAVLILISTVSTSLAIIAFFNSIQTTQHIRHIASEDISASARDESYDLSRIVVNRINSVTTNLEVLANGPSIQSENRQDVGQLFDAAQYSTDDLTEYYMWLDNEGQIAAASNIARAAGSVAEADMRLRILPVRSSCTRAPVSTRRVLPAITSRPRIG